MGRRVHHLILVALVGCGRVGFDTGIGDGPTTCTPRLVDPFDASSGLLWTSFQDPAITLVQRGGTLEIDLADQARAYGGVQLTGTIDLTGLGFQVETLEVPDQTTHAEMFLELHDDTWRTALGVANGQLLAIEERNDHSMTSSAGMTYEPTADRLWRIELLGSEIGFATSSDGAVWRQPTTLANRLDPTNITVVMYAGTYDLQPLPGVARFARAHTSDCP